MKSYQQFLAEMKRRKVFKVAGIYGIVSFGVLQAADLMLPRLGLPDWTVTFMVALVILVFPVALILAWAFEVTPDGVKRTDDAAPGEIEGLVSAPASQRWPAGLLALVSVAALLASGWWVGRRSAPESAGSTDSATPADIRFALTDAGNDTRPSLAVLPFVNMSADEEQGYFSDGITEEILNTLARIRKLRVAGRTSTFAYKGQDKDLREIGIELGVSYLVEGSVRKSGNQLRITAQLIDAADGSHMWSDQYDRPMDDVFAIQTEIAEAIAGALRVPLGLDAGESLVTPTADLAAYDLYLAGRAKMRERGPSLLEAVELFEAAIARDSTWAPAWAALAETSELRLWYPTARPDDMTRAEFNPIGLDEAERAARRSLALDPRNASALVALGSVQRNRGEWEASEATYRRALAQDPDNAEAHQQFGDLLVNVGRIAEGVRAIDRAATLDPAPVRLGMLGFAMEVDDRLGESVDLYELAVERTNTDAGKRYWGGLLGRLYITAGRFEDAIEALDEANRSDPEQEPYIGTRDQIEAFVGGLARGDLSQIPAETLDDLRPAHWLMVGEPDSAVAQLMRQAEERPFGRVFEFWRPGTNSIHSNPRIQEHLAERGLAGVAIQRTPEADRHRPMVLRDAAAP